MKIFRQCAGNAVSQNKKNNNTRLQVHTRHKLNTKPDRLKGIYIGIIDFQLTILKLLRAIQKVEIFNFLLTLIKVLIN